MAQKFCTFIEEGMFRQIWTMTVKHGPQNCQFSVCVLQATDVTKSSSLFSSYVSAIFRLVELQNTKFHFFRSPTFLELSFFIYITFVVVSPTFRGEI